MKAVVPRQDGYSYASRAQEKAASRAEDQAALDSGAKSPADLRHENGAFAFPPDRVSLKFSGRKF